MKNINKIKVLLISPEWPPAHCGIAHFSKKLYEALNKIINVDFMLLRSKKDLDSIYNKINEGGINLVHLILQMDHVLDNGYYLLMDIKDRYPDIKICISYIYSSDTEYGKIKKIVEKADQIITHGSPVFWHKLPSGTIDMPCGATVVGSNKFSKLKTEDITRFIYFGFINKNKGLNFLLNAVNKIPKEIKFELLILASLHKKYENKKNPTIKIAKDLYKNIKSLKDERVKLRIGYISDSNLKKALIRSDCCILPYLDGATNKRSSFFNALSFGLPVITTVSDKTPNLFFDIPYISFVKPGDSNSLAETISNYRKNSLQKKIVLNFFNKKFSWSIISNNIVNIYQKIIERHTVYGAHR